MGDLQRFAIWDCLIHALMLRRMLKVVESGRDLPHQRIGVLFCCFCSCSSLSQVLLTTSVQRGDTSALTKAEAATGPKASSWGNLLLPRPALPMSTSEAQLWCSAMAQALPKPCYAATSKHLSELFFEPPLQRSWSLRRPRLEVLRLACRNI
jgi:hypothetical protein